MKLTISKEQILNGLQAVQNIVNAERHCRFFPMYYCAQMASNSS